MGANRMIVSTRKNIQGGSVIGSVILRLSSIVFEWSLCKDRNFTTFEKYEKDNFWHNNDAADGLLRHFMRP